MTKQIPIPKISSYERYWLNEVYSLARQNKSVNVREIWSKLSNKLPHNFRPVFISSDLIDASGEDIRLLGVVALQKSYSVLKKINRLVLTIKKLLLKKPLEENIKIEDISEATKMTASEITFLFYLLRNYGGFMDGASYESNLLKSINFRRNSTTFYRYIGFTSIEEIIIHDQKDRKKIEAFKNPKSKETITYPDSNTLLTIDPIFTSKPPRINAKLCFVLMPFKEEWSQRVYRDIIRKNMEEMGLQCLRADDLTGQKIIEDIWVGINQAGLIITDVTNSNPNVMYELGIVHTLGKPSILITQEINNIPFDFRHLRHIEYRENTEAVKKFGNELKKHTKDIYSKKYPSIKLIGMD